MSDPTPATEDEAKAAALPAPVYIAPPAHSRAGHRTFGWCSMCPGREVWEELVAWRARNNRKHDEGVTPDRAVAPSREAADG